MPKIFFTGGGTAGHVTPNIAVIRELTVDFEIGYVGESSSVEEKLISSISVPFFKIKSGKLRRYFSLKNFYDPFKVIVGFFQSLRLCVIEKPDIQVTIKDGNMMILYNFLSINLKVSDVSFVI